MRSPMLTEAALRAAGARTDPRATDDDTLAIEAVNRFLAAQDRGALVKAGAQALKGHHSSPDDPSWEEYATTVRVVVDALLGSPDA